MITDKSDYLYTDEATLDRIKIDGDILPIRDQHQTIRSEDVVFLNEAREERIVANGGSPDVASFPVPKLQNDLIEKGVVGGSLGTWYAPGAISSSSMFLIKDESWNDEGTDISADISSAVTSLNSATTAATSARNAAYQSAEQDYSSAVSDANADYADAAAEIEATATQSTASENTRHANAVNAENDDFASDIDALKDAIRQIKADASLSPQEKAEMISEKEREIEARTLEHQEALYDEDFAHAQSIRDIENARLDSIAVAKRTLDGDIEIAANLRKSAKDAADLAYENAVSGPRSTLYGLVSSVLGSPTAYTSYTVIAANSAASSVGYKTPGEVAWEQNLKDGLMDVEHSASYQIGHAWDAKLHHGLLIWAVYSDYERMQVLRTGTSAVQGRVWVSEHHDVPISGWTPDGFKDYATNTLVGQEFAGSRGYLAYRYYMQCASGSMMRVAIPVTDSVFASFQSGAQASIELEYEVDGQEYESEERTHRTFRKVVSATIGMLAPNYHAEIDAIDDAYHATVAQNENKRKSDTAERKAVYDAAVESSEETYNAAVAGLDAQMDGTIASARTNAARQIDQISKDANTRAVGSDNPESIIQQAETQIRTVRVTMENAITEAKNQNAQSKRTLARQHQNELAALKTEYDADIADIDDECSAANRTANQSRMASRNDVNSRYTTSYDERQVAYVRDVDDAREDAEEEASHATDPSEVDRIWESMVATIDALTNTAASDLNAIDYPTEYRLYAEAHISDVFSLGVDLVSMFGELTVRPVAVRFKPNLRTLTGANFARFDEYYGDATGPSGA